MEQQLQSALAELIQLVTAGAEGAYAFGQEQIPELLTQLIVWKTCSYVFAALLCFAIATFCFWWGWKISTSPEDSDYREACGMLTDPWGIVMVGAFIVFGVFTLFGILNLSDLLQITLAPKVWLLEYAADLTSGGSK